MIENEDKISDLKEANPIDAAEWLFTHNRNCAQAICAAFGPDLGLPRPLALAVSSGLGAGLSRQAEVCGAVSGALLILGLRHNGEKAKVYQAGQEFIKRFKTRHGSIICRELLPCDISTEVGYMTAKEQGIFSSVCPKLVRAAAEILEDLIKDS